MKFGTLQVYPRQGVLKEHGLDLPSAVIGRGEGASIVIDDFSIARRHAKLTVDSGRLLVEDLGSSSGTFVDGERLDPNVRHLVEESATLRFGDIEAKYLPAASAEVSANPANLPPDAEVVSTGGLSIALVSPSVPIEPGKSQTATLVVVNRGRLVDNALVEIPDLPADWYSIDTPAFPILPGGRADVRITLHPPRRHDSICGEYTFTPRVRSQEYDEHPEIEGAFQVLPYEAASLSLEAIRSKKNFRLLAENHGNDVVRYELEGRDEEQTFKYLFETTAVELQPGQKRIINLAIRGPRKLMGRATQPPFEVIGKNVESGAEITAHGQLALNPPLEKFKMPAGMALVAMVLAVTALAVLVLADGRGTKTASAEDPFAGVHLCSDKDAVQDQAKKNADAANDKPLAGATVVGPYDGGRPIFGENDRNGAPFFAQNDARWATQEYARSTELPNGKDWCGTTIEQCGCAMTSVSVMLALYDLLQMPGGEPLSPKALNDWFNGAARQTDRGWVSRGYIYGDVIWSAANELSGEIAKTNPNARTVRFVRTGSGSEDEIRADLKAGRPVVVEVPGHWIAAVGLDGDQILINDPFYRDRKTLDAYKGKVRSSVHYEPSSDLSSVVITAPADVKFRVTDKQGRVVDTGSTGLEQPTAGINQIPGASVAKRHAWRDPTCIESAPPPDAGTNQIVLPGSRDDYIVEILDAGGQAGSVAIHTYGKDGTSSIATIEGAEGTTAEIGFDPNADKPVINIMHNGTPVATATPPAGGGAGGDDDETPTPAPTAPPVPTVTQTPFVEQRTAMTLPAEPGQSRVEVATNSGFELGDPIRFAPGQPNEEDNIIVGFGSFILATPLRFAHSPGEAISRLPRPPGQGPGLPPGITPPPSTGPIAPPDQVSMACSTIYQASPKLATLICDVQVVGDSTTTRWTINGQVVTEFSGSKSFVMTFPGDTPANVSVTVCNQTLCRSTSKNEPVEFPPNLSGTTTGGGGAGTTGLAAPTATPPAGAVSVTCGTEFDQNTRPTLAVMTCTANFSGDFTSISWSAPGAKPASKSGTSKTFETTMLKDDASAAAVKISATVCNFGTCRTSQPFTVGIGKTVTVLNTEPQSKIHQRHTVTLFAAIVGLNGIVPQGGNVQFYANDGDPLGEPAQLFTVGSTSVAQAKVDTRDGPLSKIGLHTIAAEYSGGINAFGSVSSTQDFEIQIPLPDDCDSVDEDGNLDTDETCDFSTPKNLGGGTMLNSLTIIGGISDGGVTNAVIASPGEPLQLLGSASRTEYCPGCLRQVYLGIAGYDTTTDKYIDPPKCGYNGGTVPFPSALPMAPLPFNAPSKPGVYYVRASTTLNYFCLEADIGPPNHSVGRIIVKDTVVAKIDAYANDGTPTNPWDDVLPATAVPPITTETGQRLVLKATVPVGATGWVDFEGFTNAAGTALAVPAPICPPAPNNTVPVGVNKGHACTPGEARVVSPELGSHSVGFNLQAKFRNDDPLRLLDPAHGFDEPVSVIPYEVYKAPVGPASTPNLYQIKILVDSTTTLAAVPNPVDMGQSFTLTATTLPVNGTLAETGQGGVVKFMAGTNQIGQDVTVGAGGIATMTWTPRNCHNTDNPDVIPNCPTANEGFPFDSQDQFGGVIDEYQNVRAIFSPGASALRASQSANIDIDVNPAPSSVVMSTSPTSVSVGGTFDLSATVAVVGGFPAAGQGPQPGDPPAVPATVQFKVRPATAGIGSAVNLGSPVTVVGGVASRTGQTTGGDSDAIAAAGNYFITAHYSGTSEVAPSVSTDTALTMTKGAPTLTLTLPNSGTITVGDTDPPGTPDDVRAVVNGSPSGRLDDNPARIKFFNGATERDDDPVTNLGAGVLGSEMEVSTLNAGTYSITAQYTGNDYFDAITTGAQTLVVNQFTPTVTLNAIGSATVGGNLAISGTVSGSGIRSPQGGSVSIYLGGTGGTLIGTDSSVNSDGVFSISVATGDGTDFPTACNPPSAPCYLNIVAHFEGDATNGNVGAATSSSRDATLTKRTGTITTAAVTAEVGQSVTLSATVSSGSASVSPDCTACVQFKVGPNLGSATDISTKVDLASGTASVVNVPTGASTPFSTNGAFTIWAVYDGNANVNGPINDSGTLTLATQVSVTVSAPSIVADDTAATLTATLSPSNAPGTVQFKVNGTNLGTPVTVSSGTATRSWTPTTPGTYSITASYNSSSNNFLSDPDSNTATVNVPTTVTVTLSGGGQTGAIGSPMNFPATVSPAAAVGDLKLTVRNSLGVIVFEDTDAYTPDGSQTMVWDAPEHAGSGFVASVEFIPTNPAVYGSDVSNNQTVSVARINVDVDITAPGTGTVGNAIAITVAITPNTAPGTVQVRIGGTLVGSAVAVTTGVASFNITYTPATTGSKIVTVIYTSSSSDYEASQISNTVEIVVS